MLGSSISRSIENPSIFNPADYSTVPPSVYQSNPISSPVGFDSNGNLIVTGNVRRGMHFRGTVPYESTTSFRADLGSSSLNSFLRDSAGTEDLANSANRYNIQPYYLQSRTVATTRPGYSGVFRESETSIRNRTLRGRFPTGTYVADTNTETFSARDTTTSDSGLPVVQTQFRTLTKPHTIVQSIRELQLLTRQAEENIPSKNQQLMIERYRKQTKETEDREKKAQDAQQEAGITFEMKAVSPTVEYERSLIEKYSDFDPFDINRGIEKAKAALPDLSKSEPKHKPTLAEAYAQANAETFKDESVSQQDTGQLLQTNEIIQTEGDIGLQDQGDKENMDIIEQVKQQLDDLIKTIGEPESLDSAGTSENKRTNIALSSVVPRLQKSSFNPAESVISGLDEFKGLSQADLSARAKEIRKSNTSPATFSVSRFNYHFKQAQEHLKGGRYYAAADSFALASIYKPDEPLCLAGRGHALLAAGEYISSALFLSRAIENSPEYVRAKIDLAATLGGQNILENRITDIKEWLERSSSGKLEFLLGYIYYRMGRLGPAQQAIDAAYAKMPNSVAVVTVKKAVDELIADQ